MKKLMVFAGALLALVVAAIIIIPFVVDVDKYRPQVVAAANQNLNGKLELGKLTLSLWGHILVRVDGLKLFDNQDTQLVSVDNAYIQIPFASFLTGSPVLDFKMEKPEITVVKNRAGKLNLMSLIKTTPAAPAAASNASVAPTQAALAVAKNAPAQAKSAQATQASNASAQNPAAPAAGSSGGIALPAIATHARLGVELRDALLKYADQSTGLKSETRNLNLILKNVSLSHPMDFEFWADLDTVMAKVFSVKGPLKITGEADPQFSGSEFQSAKATVNVNLDDLQIAVPGVFMKSKGVPANAEAKIDASPKQASAQITLNFHNAKIETNATVVNEPTKTLQATVSSNEISLKSWVDLLPALKGYELGGNLELKAAADGPVDKLGYSADINLKELTAKAPMLKHKPEINATIKIVTNEVQSLLLTMKAPGNDLKVTGKVVSFTAPQIQLNVDSKSLDLDQLIDFPPPAKKTSRLELIPSAFAEKTAATENFDRMLDPLRTNPALRAMVLNLGIQIGTLKAKGMAITGISSKISLKNLVAAIEKFDLTVFKGKISAKLSTDLKPTAPTYSLDTSISGLDMKEAVTSQMEMFKNTVVGTMAMSAKGTGAGFNPDEAKSHLNLKGNLKITNATFTGIDVAKMVNGAAGSALSKIPGGLGGKSLGSISNGQTKYDSITSDFTISGGKFSSPNFFAKAQKNAGLDIKGATEFGLIDQSINASWNVIDTYNVTHARDLSVNVTGTQIDHVLAKGNDPVSFPITVRGTLSSPQYSYSEVPKHFAEVAMSNMSGAAKSQAKKQILNALGGSGGAGGLFNGLGKKLFH